MQEPVDDPVVVATDAGAMPNVTRDSGAPVHSDAGASMPVTVGHPHKFLASVHGGGADKLVYVDVDDPKQNWELAVRDGIQDLQLIGNDKLLLDMNHSLALGSVRPHRTVRSGSAGPG